MCRWGGMDTDVSDMGALRVEECPKCRLGSGNPMGHRGRHLGQKMAPYKVKGSVSAAIAALEELEEDEASAPPRSPAPLSPTADAESEEEMIARPPADDTACQVCSWDGDDAKMVLCDGCPHGYHTYCLLPALKRIPAGDWFCPSCDPVGMTGLLASPAADKVLALALQYLHPDRQATQVAAAVYERDREEECPKCRPGSGNVLGHRGRHLGVTVPRMAAEPAPAPARKKQKTSSKEERQFALAAAAAAATEEGPMDPELAAITKGHGGEKRKGGWGGDRKSGSYKNKAKPGGVAAAAARTAGPSPVPKLEYEVARVQDRRVKRNGAVEYKVMWEGFDEDESTWEPENVLTTHAPAQLETYRHASKKSKKEKKPALVPSEIGVDEMEEAGGSADSTAAAAAAAVVGPGPCPHCIAGSGKPANHKGRHVMVTLEMRQVAKEAKRLEVYSDAPCPRCKEGSGNKVSRAPNTKAHARTHRCLRDDLIECDSV